MAKSTISPSQGLRICIYRIEPDTFSVSVKSLSLLSIAIESLKYMYSSIMDRRKLNGSFACFGDANC
jgi:hypothetical protein